MPNIWGGDQLDPEYAPWAKTKLSPEEQEVVENINQKNRELEELLILMEPLQIQERALRQQIEDLQKQCPHRNVTYKDSGKYYYNLTSGTCVDCGKDRVC